MAAVSEVPEESEETDDQRRKRGLPPEPRPPGRKGTKADPPAPVKVSVVLWGLAGLLLAGGFGYTLTSETEIAEELIRLNTDPNITDAQLRAGTESFLWVLFVGSLVFAVLYWLFAYKAREGTRSARMILTVLAVVTLIFQLVLFANLITLASAFFAAAAVALMYLPSVADYFPKVPKSLP